MNEIINVDADGFEREVLQSERPVVVDFWAAWCGPCRMQAPALEELARRRTDVKVVKVDVDANQELAAGHGVQSIPTVMLFRDGQAAVIRVGLQSTGDLETLVGPPAQVSGAA